MTIGELANQAEVNTQTIRFYERKGLVLPESRTSAGYRKYTGEALRRVLFIKHAKAIGFTLKEIDKLLSLQVGPGSTCADVKREAEDKLENVANKISQLETMKVALERLIEQCDDSLPAKQCPIIEALDEIASE